MFEVIFALALFFNWKVKDRRAALLTIAILYLVIRVGPPAQLEWTGLRTLAANLGPLTM
jgi:hypothetical protein